jgi:hypothetical protein
MKFRTEIKNINIPFSISHEDKLVMLGSCFTENIAKKLIRYKFDTLYNPFGIMYNPVSVSKIILNAIEGINPKAEDLIKRDDIWHHFDYHGDMSGIYPEEVIKKATLFSENLSNYLKATSVLFITIGTSIVYKRIDTGEIVANNHKFPSSFFTKTRLEISEVVNNLTAMINSLKTINPRINIVLTTSPVRHIKDGIIENQRSKAVLVLAIEKLLEIDNCYYFPSYELLIDDLRDYRFYTGDLVHPSTEAIEYIWEIFSDAFFDKKTMELICKIEKITKSLEHRPINPKSNSYKSFLSNLKKEISLFNKEYPNLKFKK